MDVWDVHYFLRCSPAVNSTMQAILLELLPNGDLKHHLLDVKHW